MAGGSSSSSDAVGEQVQRVVGGDERPVPVDDEGRVRLVRPQEAVERLAHRRHLAGIERPLAVQRSVPGGEQQPVALAQRDLEPLREVDDHLAARPGAACLHEAQMTCRHVAFQRQVELRQVPAFAGKGHIPGSSGVHCKRDLQDPIRREFIGPQAFSELMDRMGIGNDTKVVLYGGNNNWFAAYAYWYFKYYGHENVKLIDGGRKKWELERRPMMTDQPTTSKTAGYRTRGPVPEIRALRRFVQAEVLGKPGFGLVDVRSPEEFRGELLAPPHLPQEQAQRPGHIPGARNIPPHAARFRPYGPGSRTSF